MTSGHRLTLTYNLFASAEALATAEEVEAAAAAALAAEGDAHRTHAHYRQSLQAVPALPPPRLSGLDARGTGVYAALRALAELPTFLPAGGTIAFVAQHAYPVATRLARHRAAALLKGPDLVRVCYPKAPAPMCAPRMRAAFSPTNPPPPQALAAAAQALGLRVRVDLVLDTNTEEPPMFFAEYARQGATAVLAGPAYRGVGCWAEWDDDVAQWLSGWELAAPKLQGAAPGAPAVPSLLAGSARDLAGPFLQSLRREQPALAQMHLGNDPWADVLYGLAMIIVDVPPFQHDDDMSAPPLGRHE